MSGNRCTRTLLLIIASQGIFFTAKYSAATAAELTRFVRYQTGADIHYGIVEGERIRELKGDIFGQWQKTDRLLALADVTILVPCTPSKVVALAGNYRDHLGTKPVPPHPEPFLKVPSSLQRHEGPILLPTDAEDVHHEAELVIVIGKPTYQVPLEQALDHVLGVTIGNDVSARIWQKKDVQWWRAKGCDTFGPCGPYIVAGIDYNRLNMELRVNGQVRQKSSTANQIHNVAETVSFISQHMTLNAGDLIFTGTPGQTTPIVHGDVVEVEIEQLGILRNPVVSLAEQKRGG